MTRDGEPRYPEVCAAVVTSIKATLEADLAGLYLHGSFVTGDFNERRSDLDFLAILHRDPVDDDIPRLTEMHDAIVARYPGWIDRVEVAYLSAKAIQAFREARHPIAVISPGEPLNLKEAGSEWLINWYIARTFGLTIAGPPAADLIPLITHEEYVATARQQARDWADRVPGITGDPGLSYAVLSACRAMYTCDTGDCLLYTSDAADDLLC